MTLKSWTAYAYLCDGTGRDDCTTWSPTAAEELEDATELAEEEGWYIGTDGRSWCPEHRRAVLAREERP